MFPPAPGPNARVLFFRPRRAQRAAHNPNPQSLTPAFRPPLCYNGFLTIYQLRRETFVPAPLPAVFEFFSAAQNLAAITPPWMHFRILTPEPIALRSGAQLNYTLRVRGLPVRWTTIIETWDPPREFSDFQARGPYKLWRHTHRFREADGGTWMEDVVRYALPFGPVGRLAHALFVRRDLESVFDYRAARIRERFGSR